MSALSSLSAAVELAAARVYKHGAVRVTPLEPTRILGPAATAAFLKLENEQVTGSFKARGAVNAITALIESATPAQRAAGIVAASSGNHARGVAVALQSVPGGLGIPASIFVPSSVAPVKIKALRDMGVPVVVSEDSDCGKVEAAARALAERTGALYISPYNDINVAAGQGTAGIEIAEQLSEVDRRAAVVRAAAPAAAAPPPLLLGPGSGPVVVFVPVGGGGLISGVAAALKARLGRPGQCVVIGTQPAENACLALSVAAGRILDDGEGGFRDGDTLSDGTAGGIEAGAFTFDAALGAATDRDAVVARIQSAREAAAASAAAAETAGASAQLVDGFWLVSEAQIRQGMLAVLDAHHKVIEGAAGTAVAAAQELAAAGALEGCTVVVFCCGGNVSTERLRALLLSEQAANGGGGAAAP